MRDTARRRGRHFLRERFRDGRMCSPGRFRFKNPKGSVLVIAQGRVDGSVHTRIPGLPRSALPSRPDRRTAQEGAVESPGLHHGRRQRYSPPGAFWPRLSFGRVGRNPHNRHRQVASLRRRANPRAHERPQTRLPTSRRRREPRRGLGSCVGSDAAHDRRSWRYKFQASDCFGRPRPFARLGAWFSSTLLPAPNTRARKAG
mmetsp:Transcript_1874/g.2917  ORF Transcript_1874/g.2917 Transcript_1874/m.2917 type:complete len:201 (+) Transcript_1874:317-919(+)